MTIGQNIRMLRRKANITQEELAEMLCISSQAVSRWETESTMPDITLLPSLCSIFNVSADDLLGIDIMKQDEEIDEIRKKANSFICRGHADEARKILEDGLHKFPKSYLMIRDLMFVASEQGRNSAYTDEQRKLFKEEAIQLGEKILSSCTQEGLRDSATQVLCYAYSDLGNIEKAQTIAQKMPHMAVCRQSLLSRISVGDAKLKAKQNELHLYVQFLTSGIFRMNTKMDNGELMYNDEECAVLREKAIALLDVIFEDGNFGFYHTHLTDIHSEQAEYYAKLKMAEKTLYHLKKASDHAIAFLKWDTEKESYTCLLFRGMGHGSFSTNRTYNDALYVLKVMAYKKFEFLYENQEFIDIKSQLEPLAKHW